MKINSNWFKEYAQWQKELLNRLESFELPKPVKWEIDWTVISTIVNSNNDWKKLPVYNKLLQHRNLPAIYYFRINQIECERIHKLFLASKLQSSTIKKEKGLREKGFRNISYVRPTFDETEYLYVGSRKKDVHTRFKQHLGYSSGRTGALHIAEVFRNENEIPAITFYCHLLDTDYDQLTENIECVIQKHFKPLIGKHSFVY